MKHIYLTILLLFSTLSHFAQVSLIQMGMVREQNSGKKPIADAQIVFSNAVPATSDQSGKFRLAFSGKKAGDLVFMTEITKKGYELVNNKELENIKLSNTEQFGIDIILAKAGSIDAAKKEYYAVSDKALLAGFNKKKKALLTQIENSEISQQAYIDQIEDLQKQYDRQQMQLDALAEKFAKVNFDDVSAVYKEALELFKAGKIDEALQKLEDADFLKRSEEHLRERERIKNAIENVEKEKNENESGIKEDIRVLLLKAGMHTSKGEYYEAEPLYDQVLLLDSTDLTILQTCVDFYEKSNLFRKALPLYPKIIEHPQVSEEQKIKAQEALNIHSQSKQ